MHVLASGFLWIRDANLIFPVQVERKYNVITLWKNMSFSAFSFSLLSALKVGKSFLNHSFRLGPKTVDGVMKFYNNFAVLPEACEFQIGVLTNSWAYNNFIYISLWHKWYIQQSLSKTGIWNKGKAYFKMDPIPHQVCLPTYMEDAC